MLRSRSRKMGCKMNRRIFDWLGWILGACLFASLLLSSSPGNAADGEAGIQVYPTSGLVTNENGGSDTFNIVLTARPGNPVDIPLSSSDPSEGSLLLTLAKFTPGNWNVPQEIVVIGVNDYDSDGDLPYKIITGPAVSRDTAYDGFNAEDVSVLNLDDSKPSTQDDSAQTPEDTPLTVNVLANDSGLLDVPLSVSIDTSPQHGSAHISAGNQAGYNPAPNFAGSDQLIYKVCDADNDCSTAGLAITVTPVNDPPSAADDQAITSLNVPVMIDVLANDADLDGDPLLLHDFQTTSSKGGSITRDDNGSPVNKQDDKLFYSPLLGFTGEDRFAYTISDGPLTAQAAVVVTVSPGGPVAINDEYQAVQGQPLIVNSTNGVLKNDIDPLGQGLSAIWVSGPGHGSLDLQEDGSFSYTPDAAFQGNDSFKYKAFDGVEFSKDATVKISVQSSSGIPLANEDSYSTGQMTVLTIAAPGVLENDSDPNGDPLVTQLVAPPNHGSLVLNANGSFTFTPNGTYVGIDNFTYVASDGSNQSNQAEVSLDIKDQINPVVSWVAPVRNGGIYDVKSGIVQLAIEASDNVAIARVRFYRWDSVDNKYIDIGEDLAAPYQLSLSVDSLNLTWNQIFVRSYDQEGNPSDQQFIWLYKTGQPVYLPLILH